MNNKEKTVVSVTMIEKECGNTEFQISQPMNQERLSVETASTVLIGGLGVIIKSCKLNKGGIKDYELIEEIIEGVKHYFTSSDAFEDVKRFENEEK